MNFRAIYPTATLRFSSGYGANFRSSTNILWSRRLTGKRLGHLVAHGIVNKENIRPWEWRDITVRAMHDIAIKDNHAAWLALN